MALNSIDLIAIRLPQYFEFERYLDMFDIATQNKIRGYRLRYSQMVAFCSTLLKKYYLAKYLNLSPKHILIEDGKYGKPCLNLPALDIDFNISHSGEYLVMIIGKNCKVGIDIEEIDYSINAKELAPQIFNVQECKLIADNVDNFFVLWSKKEALLKALGYGFRTNHYKTTNLNLNNFEINSTQIIYTTRLFNIYQLSVVVTHPKSFDNP